MNAQCTLAVFLHPYLAASMRQSAWLALLGVLDLEEARLLIRSNLVVGRHTSSSSTNQQTELIKNDVGRSALFRYEAVTGSLVKGEQQSEVLKEKLASVVNAVVSAPLSDDSKPALYYQGLHDVASVLLFNLNYDEVKTAALLRKLVETHLQDAVQEDFANVTILLDNVLMPYLYSVDAEIYQAIVESELPITNSVMPWLITLFTHDVHDTAVVSRLMDAFIASHPALPFYMAVALLVHPHLRHRVLEASFDPGMMHMAIHELPGEIKNDFTSPMGGGDEVTVTAQEVIESALNLMKQTPPEALLQFVGAGLKPRTRKRLVNKLCRVSVLNIGRAPRADFTLAMHLETMIQCMNTLSRAQLEEQFRPMWNKARQAYQMTLSQGSKIIMYSRDSLNVVQIIVMFLLMPQQYVGDFVYLMRMASRLCVRDTTFLPHYQTAPLLNASAKSSPCRTTKSKNDLVYEDNDVPEMMKSMSTVSFPELENGFSENV